VDSGRLHHWPPPPDGARVNNHICHSTLVPRSRAYPHKAAWRRKENICFKRLFYGAGILKIAVISTIFLARPTKISVPKRRGHLAYLHRSPEISNEPENYRMLNMASGFPQFRRVISRNTARRSIRSIQTVSRQFNCLLGPKIRGWPHRRDRKWCLCMTPAVGGQWCNRPLSTVHCPLSTVHCPLSTVQVFRIPALHRLHVGIKLLAVKPTAFQAMFWL
jgi:hypothetical protein